MIGLVITDEQPGYAKASDWCNANGAFIQHLGNGLFEIKPNPAQSAEIIKARRIREIKAELYGLDLKRIRPLAEGDLAYLESINAEVATLREEMRGLLV